MTELHQTLHNEAGICLWTILAACALIAVVVIMLIHLVGRGARRAYNNKKIRDYNKEMGALYEANRVETSERKNSAEEYLAGINTQQAVAESNAEQTAVPNAGADNAEQVIEENDSEIVYDYENPEKLFDGRK